MRKQIGLKLPLSLIRLLDKLCARDFKTRTAFIEQAIHEKLKRDGVKLNEGQQPIYFSGDIDDMPLFP